MVGCQRKMVAKQFTHVSWPQLIVAQKRKCFYCGKYMPASGFTRDHLRPRCEGNALPLNQVLCCGRCNRKKGRRAPTERELQKARVIYISLGAPGFAI
jgi:5-methylcytosine-specific restriction endonuclease McrA